MKRTSHKVHQFQTAVCIDCAKQWRGRSIQAKAHKHTMSTDHEVALHINSIYLYKSKT